MSGRSWFGRRQKRYEAVTDEERIARYVYLLNTLPASVIESAHATAFQDLPPRRRREMFEQLRPFMADGASAAASDDPVVLAKLVRSVEEARSRRSASRGDDARGAVATEGDGGPLADQDPRDALLRSSVAAIVAQNFLLSVAVTTYFTMGAGSLALASEPGWIGQTYEPATYGAADGSVGGDLGGGFGAFDGGGFDGGFGGGFGGGDGGAD